MTENPIVRHSKFVVLNTSIIGAAVGIFLMKAGIWGMLVGVLLGAGLGGFLVRTQKGLESHS